MKLLLFATQLEAEPTLSVCKATRHQTSAFDFPLYKSELGWIAITGMGLFAAQQVIGCLAFQFDEIWHLGFAGGLSPEFPLGSIHTVSSTAKYIPFLETLDAYSKEMVEKIYPPIELEAGNVRLLSSDFPLHCTNTKHSLVKSGDLIDMEGYGIAYAAQQWKKPCLIRKIVSDLCVDGGRETLLKNAKPYAEKLAEDFLASKA